MTLRRLSLGLGGPVFAILLLVECVGSEPDVSSHRGDGTGSDAAPTDASSGTDARRDAGLVDGTAKPPCAIAQAGAPGTLDPAFANGLKKYPGTNTFDVETAAIDSQGRIYLVGRAGKCTSPTFDVAVMRLAASGAPDVTFGSGNGFACFDSKGDDSIVAAYVDASDRLVFAGSGGTKSALVGRMLPTGSLDPAFASGKLLVFTPETPMGGNYTAYGVSQDGNGILVSGSDWDPFFATSSTKGWVVRVSDNGVVDSAAFTPYVTSNVAGFRAGHVKLDGKLYLPAKKTASDEWTMVILDDKGNALGTPGAVLPPGATSGTTPAGVVVATAATADEQLLVVGPLASGGAGAAAAWWTKSAVPTGPVPSFPSFFWDPAYNRTPLARQCDHKALIAAVTSDTFRPIIARLVGRDGTPDTTWGQNGTTTIEFDAGSPDVHSSGVAIVERKDGRLVVVAQTSEQNGAWVFQLLP